MNSNEPHKCDYFNKTITVKDCERCELEGICKGGIPGWKNKINIEIDDEYLEFIKEKYIIFHRHLQSFIEICFLNNDYIPIKIHFTLFKHPEELDYIDPMIMIYYKSSEKFHIVKLRDEFEERFKSFLVQMSHDAEEFKIYWENLKDFRIHVRRVE